MCGISGVELAIILAAAIIILGPEKLPEMLRGIAKLSGQIRGIAGELQDVGREVVREIPKMPDVPKDLPRDFVKKALLDSPEGGAERSRRRARPRDPAAEAEVDRIRARQRAWAEGENEALQERAARSLAAPSEGDGGDGGSSADSVDPGGVAAGDTPPEVPPATSTGTSTGTSTDASRGADLRRAREAGTEGPSAMETPEPGEHGAESRLSPRRPRPAPGSVARGHGLEDGDDTGH